MAYNNAGKMNLTLSSCGIPAVNYICKMEEVRLQPGGGCGRVKYYCSDECKAWHANTHKEELLSLLFAVVKK